jgi:hypothetical protein
MREHGQEQAGEQWWRRQEGFVPMIWLTAAVLISGAALFSFGPTLQIWQRRVIKVRAAQMTMVEMWAAAWERGRQIYPEMERRAKQDV